MKLQTAIALLAAASPAAAQYDPSIPNPVCAKFNDINVEGVGEFVNTDGSGGQPITTGDMSISFSLVGQTALGSYPNQVYFRNINLDLNAVCVTKRDQGIFGAPPQDAPVCFYEAELGFCRPFIFVEDPVLVERVARSQVVNPADFFPVVGGRRLVERSDVPDAESDAEAGNLRRDLQRDTIFDGDDDKVEAIRITDKIRSDNLEIIEKICPAASLACWVPFPLFCIETRSGGFTAHGTGSSNIKITGGTADLFGAFGQILTPDSGIDITFIDPFTGDIKYNFDVGIEICYYQREDPGFF